jgi:subtilisin family serine protease
MEWKYALALMIGNNVKVINISMKPNDDLVNNSKSIENLLSKLLDKGYDFLIVSAAGNDTKDVANASSYFNKIDKSSPVYNHIIVVGAIDFYSYGWTKEDADKTFAYDQINDKADMEYVLCNFSNYGNRMDIVAPGELITTLDIIANQPYCNNFEGTSAAAPHVAGVAGLVYSVNPYLTGAQVKEIIINSAKNSAKSDPNRLITKTVIDGKNTITYSYPLLDAKAAVDEAINRRVYGPPVVIPVDKDYAIVYGDVTDTLGGYIEEAKILVTSKETSEQQTFYTDNDGNYVLTLNPGTYDIKFSTGSAGPFGGWFLGNDYAYHTIKNKTILANDAYPLDVELDNKAVKSVGVFDSNGYPIDYIGVTVTNTTSNEKYETTINSDGILYNGVDDGIYTIDLSKDGYLPKTLDVEVKDETIFDEDGNVLNQIFLDPIEVTISGTVTEYDRTTKETKPLKNFKVAIYQQTEGVTGDSIIASGTTSSDGTYKITFNQQGDFVVKFSENKQVPISVYNGKYTVDMQFELDDEEYTVIDDLSDGIWCQTDKGYYIKIYTTDNTGKYTQTLVPESWGTSTYAIHRWNKELKMATYNSSGNLINDRTLDYFYDESDIYFNDINDKYKIDEITSINITSTGLTYTIHSHGFYKSKTNFIGSISYYKEEWEKDNVTTVSFYNNSQKISMSTQSPF